MTIGFGWLCVARRGRIEIIANTAFADRVGRNIVYRTKLNHHCSGLLPRPPVEARTYYPDIPRAVPNDPLARREHERRSVVRDGVPERAWRKMVKSKKVSSVTEVICPTRIFDASTNPWQPSASAY